MMNIEKGDNMVAVEQLCQRLNNYIEKHYG